MLDPRVLHNRLLQVKVELCCLNTPFPARRCCDVFLLFYCESDLLDQLSCKGVDKCQWLCALFMQDFALEAESQQCPAFSERRACPCVLVWLLVFGAMA